MAAVLAALFLAACSKTETNNAASFIQIGDFTVHRIASDYIEVRDGAGRSLTLIPRGTPKPEGVDPVQVVEVPVRRVAAYGYFDVAILRALGVLDTLVGVTTAMDHWHVKEVKDRMASGKIAFLGDYTCLDFEKLKLQEPELVLTWDPSIVPMLNDLNIPCAITTTPVAMCLNARMRFVQFLAPFFGREKEANAYFDRVNQALVAIRKRTENAGPMPGVMWGDIYEKRVLVEPGNAWVGELINLAESDYLFEDVYGTSCIEISTERFLTSGQDADILFTYRTPEWGATSKQALARLNPLFKDIRPLKQGKVYAPLPHYSQSGDRLDEILTEIAAILHPEVYSDYELRFFLQLPDTDPPNRHGRLSTKRNEWFSLFNPFGLPYDQATIHVKTGEAS